MTAIDCLQCNLVIVLSPKEQPTRIMRGECECGIVIEVIYPRLVLEGEIV